MTKLHRLLRPTLPLALLTLAACSGGTDDAPARADDETAIPVEPDGGIGDGAGPPDRPSTAESIPASFQGVWDRADGSCDTLSETRIEVAPKSIGFYESQGEVTDIEVEAPNRVVLSLAMEGEGERWQVARMFELSDDGRTLTATAADQQPSEPITLEKCSN